MASEYASVGSPTGGSTKAYGTAINVAPVSPVRDISPIEQQVRRLDEQLGDLSDNLAALVGQTMPILRHDPRQVIGAEEGKTPPPSCPLESQIRELNDRLNASIGLVMRIRENVCL